MADQTLNLPSLFLVLVILILSIRYFFFGGPGTSTHTAARDRNTANPEHIEQIAQMFPQLSRRDIQWDLQRNGGSVQATTERVLSGRGLERPPPSFQPLPPPASSSSNTPSSPAPHKSSHPDLLTRYKLHHRLSQPDVTRSGEEEGEKPKPPQWSQNRDERQALLQKRREDMVLAARRKLEEKERREKAGK
ncbi:MAG: hypothetical protein LQ346_007086 [Caloplaca aetnensis]|nr:MAG: hypothetical protein LQ346_007086 [Caloplaca aetnensis]